MRFVCYKLTFKAPFHTGDRENFLDDTLSYIPSDTLFSAFCHSYLLLFGKTSLENLLKRFNTDVPPFQISSCFPYQQNRFFLPMPLDPSRIPAPAEDTPFKKYKKVKFVEKSVFERLINEPSSKLKEDDVTIPPLKKDSPVYTKNIVPRIAVSRINNHPGENYFHFGEIAFYDNCGLFFLAKFNNESEQKLFEATLNLMQDEGIGGNRTVGKGIFKYERMDNFEIKIPQNNKGCVILSLYSPKETEIEHLKNGFYELIERKGYIYSPWIQSFRKKSAILFVEGSVFRKQVYGQLLDVTPQIHNETLPHRIYKYAFAFSISYPLQ